MPQSAFLRPQSAARRRGDRINRRDVLFVLLALGFCSLPLGAHAQRKVWRIGWILLRSRPASLESDYLGGLSRGLRKLGYVEGRDFVIDWHFADGDHLRLPALAAELVRRNPDLIMASGTPAALAAKRATEAIPIVIAGVTDPVATGLVASLRRPGQNITGVTTLGAEAGSKHIEYLRSVLPKLSRVAALVDPSNPGHTVQLKSIQAAAKSAGINVVSFGADTVGQIDAAFRRMAQERLGALVVVSSPFFVNQARQLADLTLAHRIVTIFEFRLHVTAGGLMSYGQDLEESMRGAAQYVDRILKGAKPAELPVQQATRLELVINQKTAKALGIKFPQEILVRADEVIE